MFTKMLTNLREQISQPADHVSVLRADVTDEAGLMLTGETLRNGRPQFTISVTTEEAALTVVYTLDSHFAARRLYKRLLRQWQ